ncbi:MAG: NAD(P)/FAD-dependent oxidoreductase, partial [Bacillota bacterium]|nr:NAD(P)/FAD-dependent oxidoreductase [Bacillota bacterium]
MSRPRVVIAGMGFGGLFAFHRLAKKPVDLLLVDRHNYHAFVPLFYQVAAAELEPVEIAYPIRTFLRRHPHADFLMADIEGVDLQGKKLLTAQGEVPYDYLILGLGSETSFFGLPGVKEHSFPVKSLAQALTLRNHILTLFERASRLSEGEEGLLTFVIAGGGPTGVELAATLAEWIRDVLRKDYPPSVMEKARVLLVEATERILLGLPESQASYAQGTLEKLGVEVRTGTPIAGAEKGRVLLNEGEAIPTHTLIWTAGVKGSSLGERLGLPLSRGARVPVNEFLQLPDHPDVYVVGDLSYVEDGAGRPLPQVAPVAIQEGRQAAENIARVLQGKPPLPFRYKDPGVLLSIGRGRGVARIGKIHLKGFPAWLAWAL